MNEQDTIREAMRLLGRRKSERKAEASRKNGKLGGRPRVKADSVPNPSDGIK